jgi:hypothetical protein
MSGLGIRRADPLHSDSPGVRQYHVRREDWTPREVGLRRRLQRVENRLACRRGRTRQPSPDTEGFLPECHPVKRER